MTDEMYCGCGNLMTPIYGVVATDDEHDESYEGLLGFECDKCLMSMDLNGEVE